MKIAAVIPVRNRPELLQRAVRSIQAQTRKPDEIIIVDDASTDDTPLVAKEMAANDARIRVIEQPICLGCGGARNTAWRCSDADWIALLDSDDEWMPEKLECQEILLHGDAVAVFTGLRARTSDYIYIPPQNVSLFELRCANVLNTPSSAIIRRSALEDIGGFDEHIPTCEDWDMWFKLRKVGRIDVVPKPLIFYDRDTGDNMSRNMNNVLAGHAIVFARTLEGTKGFQRLRIKGRHESRISQIMCDDFRKPFRGMLHSIKSGLIWPSGHALNRLRQSITMLNAKH